jgi:hypothetical protein
MNDEIKAAVELLANNLTESESGKAYKVEYASQSHTGLKITVTNHSKKPRLNYAEAFEVMKEGKKVRIVHENKDTHKWIEYINEAGGRVGFFIMTEKGLSPWEPSPTINELQLDCFVIIE